MTPASRRRGWQRLAPATGAAALIAAERWPEADVAGIDVSPKMVELARAKATRPGVRFLVADLAELDPGDGFALVIMMNMPPFFEPVSRLVSRGGHVAKIASRGPATPFHSSAEQLREGFGARGLETVAAGTAGPGTYYLARRP